MRAGAARRRDLSRFLSTFRSVSSAESARGLHQRASDAETTPSRILGAGVVVRMRENADLALIHPVETSALVGGGILRFRGPRPKWKRHGRD